MNAQEFPRYFKTLSFSVPIRCDADGRCFQVWGGNMEMHVAHLTLNDLLFDVSELDAREITAAEANELVGGKG